MQARVARAGQAAYDVHPRSTIVATGRYSPGLDVSARWSSWASWRAGDVAGVRSPAPRAVVDECNAMNAPNARALFQAPLGQNQAPGAGVLHQLMSLLRALRASPHRRRLALLAAGIVVVICANLVGQVRLNIWQGDFYNALERRQLEVFLNQLFVFVVIIAGLLTLVVAETWLRQMVEVRMREWLTHDLLDQWLAPKRAHLLAFAGEIGVNPDQRMQADAQHLTELSADLSIGLLRASLLLVGFAGVLWLLSDQVLFLVHDQSFTIPGYLVWCALAYALSGSWLTWRVGRPLIAINAERYAREAELRFALVRISEHAEGIALHGGEADERRALDRPVDRVVLITRRLANGLARLTWITSGYGWLALVVPIAVAAPGYFAGSLSFGALMMVVGAFNQVQQALRWFVDNFPRIADWRATLLRVVEFRDVLPSLAALGEEAGHIEFVAHPAGRIALNDLSVALVEGRAVLDEPRIELSPGDHLLIVGAPGSGKSTLFRALAGLWPWGTGVVQLPPRAALMFVPQRPYLPLGTLRTAIAYPAQWASFDDAALQRVLARVGLDHLAAALDTERRWDNELTLDEQQRLAFARILLHAPQGVVLDDAMASLDEEHRRLMLSIFERELAGTTVVSIGRGPAHDGFYNRTVRLRRIPGGAGLRVRPRAREVPAQPSVLPARSP